MKSDYLQNKALPPNIFSKFAIAIILESYANEADCHRQKDSGSYID